MERKINISSWSFNDLFSESFWGELFIYNDSELDEEIDWDDSMVDYPDLWNELPDKEKFFLFEDSFQLFTGWLDLLETEEYINYCNVILSNTPDIVEIIATNTKYADFITDYANEKLKQVEQTQDKFNTEYITELAKEHETVILAKNNTIIIAGNNLEKVKSSILSYMMSGYDLIESSDSTNYEKGEKVYIYTVEYNPNANIMGLS